MIIFISGIKLLKSKPNKKYPLMSKVKTSSSNKSIEVVKISLSYSLAKKEGKGLLNEMIYSKGKKGELLRKKVKKRRPRTSKTRKKKGQRKVNRTVV